MATATTVPNISFSGFFDGYSDRDRQIAEERGREQDRINWENAAAERERKRLMAEEALRFWGLEDVSKARLANELGTARNTLWTQQAMSGVRDNLSPDEVAMVRLEQARAGLRRDQANVQATDAGTGAIATAPWRFDPASKELETARAGIGGPASVTSLQRLLGPDAATMTESGTSTPGGMTLSDAESQTYLKQGVEGVLADRIAQEKAIAALGRTVGTDATRPNPNIKVLQDQIEVWSKRLENTRDPAERERINAQIQIYEQALSELLPIPQTTAPAPVAPPRVSLEPIQAAPSVSAPVAATDATPVVAPVAKEASTQPASQAVPQTQVTDREKIRLEVVSTNNQIQQLKDELREIQRPRPRGVPAPAGSQQKIADLISKISQLNVKNKELVSRLIGGKYVGQQ